jgi:hypothetical protein
MPAAIEPRLLILCPLAREWSFLVSTFDASLHVERLHHLKIEAAYIPDWRALVAPGGHGKTQFAVQASESCANPIPQCLRRVSGTLPLLRGTDGSNPSPSSGESDANLTSSIRDIATVTEGAALQRSRISAACALHPVEH